MSYERRLDALERTYQRAEPPRFLVLDELPDGRLVEYLTREEVEPRAGDAIIVIKACLDGRQ